MWTRRMLYIIHFCRKKYQTLYSRYNLALKLVHFRLNPSFDAHNGSQMSLLCKTAVVSCINNFIILAAIVPSVKDVDTLMTFH